ncbi:NADH dehydrogenase (quinone) subunit D [Phototrophicus methaneseepsis]|uniref:NADH-quinone oxidoreductase subunit D n=2 Tax=Phototrophicus methaneseepsis TaxID=2710758 RepID=A0A7S8ED45_9CHLR|nr:NADH dehydrogenase (quinone) subunit D [Phototrophicus methaneseepsis]QPC84760.1 NADH dehydrogenase (quinone) subunit D [Phototrophicus methaneseepsis]
MVVEQVNSQGIKPTWEGDLDQIKHLVSDRAITGETMLLNMGPHHPSTHGVLRLLLELDGEEIVTLMPDVGFLHTGIEKSIEDKSYEKGVPLTDRMDYLTPLSNNMVFSMAIEKMVELEVPERAQTIRVILLELMRIASHMVWLGTQAMDMGAMSMFLYCFREREKILHILEMCSGQRMMTSYIRPGGVWRDIPEGFHEAVNEFIDYFPPKIDDYERLLVKNPIWMDRTQGVGIIEPDLGLAYGVTGPSLRGSGVNWDIRKAMPYSGYETYDFNVPLGEHGDVYDRFMVRLRELRESLKIVKQGIDRLDKHGPFRSSNRKFVPPPRSALGHSMEAVIHHFKLWTQGYDVPDEEVFTAIESPRGEISCYLHGTGENRPRRVHFKTPSFMHIAAMPMFSEGYMLADLIGIIGSVDIVLGDCDR